MKNKLILVEGIPGSGKTTIAQKIRDYFIELGYKVILYQEGDSHPTDLAWNAYVTLEEYEVLIQKYKEQETLLRKHTIFEEDYAIIAYTKLGYYPNENELMDYLEAHEVYNGRVPLETFKKVHFNRWEQFAKNNDGDSIVIFECSYMQNHLNELIAYHDKDESYIINYMLELIDKVKTLNPKLVYLSQPDVRKTIMRVSKERVSGDKSKYPDWIDLVNNYIENSYYGKKYHLKGVDGSIKFFEVRKQMELKVFEKLTIDKVIIENKDYQWKEVVNEVLNSLS